MKLKDTERAPGGKPYQKKSTATSSAAVETLAALGLTYKTSALAQKLTELPDDAFERVRLGIWTVTKAIREVNHARRSIIESPSCTRSLPAPWRWTG